MNFSPVLVCALTSLYRQQDILKPLLTIEEILHKFRISMLMLGVFEVTGCQTLHYLQSHEDTECLVLLELGYEAG
jgi:hypothetical protein